MPPLDHQPPIIPLPGPQSTPQIGRRSTSRVGSAVKNRRPGERDEAAMRMRASRLCAARRRRSIHYFALATDWRRGLSPETR